MQNVPDISDIDRVAGVVTTLISRDTVESPGKDVDDLTFSFVSPLNTDDGEVLLHLAKCVPAWFFNFFEVGGYQWVDTALIEVIAVDAAGIDDFSRGVRGCFDQEGTAQKNFATCAASRALTVPPLQQLVILSGVYVGPDETAHFARGLFGAELKARQLQGHLL
jgi:hypothetical protein